MTTHADFADSVSPLDLQLLRRAIALSYESRQRGRHPFAALVADEAGNIIASAGNNSMPPEGDPTQHAELVAGISVGDEVMTAGGILGRVTGVSEHYAVVQIAENTEIKIQKASISQVVPKGTFEEA